MTSEPTMQIHPRGGIDSWSEGFSTPWVIGLGALLAVQLLAAILLAAGGRGSLDPAALDQPLLGVAPGRVTGLTIEGSDGELVQLRKSGDGWVLPGLGDFPADGAKVERLVEQLAGLKRPLPVATSPESLTRHRVADDQFERKVSLDAGDQTLATLILGDSPGFRRLFARPAGEPAVYDIDLALFDASDRRDDWIARDALRIPKAQINGVATPNWTLVEGEDGWQLDGSEQAPDPQAVEDLLSRISALGYRGVLGTEDDPVYNQSQPMLELTIALADGTKRDYRISKPDDSDDLVLKSSDRPWYFKLSEYDADGLVDIDRAALLGEDNTREPEPLPADEPEDGSEPAPLPGDPHAAGSEDSTGQQPVTD